jgi:uncharacterized protein with HEPN domain
MSPRSRKQRLADIRDAVAAIADHRQEARQVGLPGSSAMLLDSVVRQLAIVGEAASHLPEVVLQRHPEIPGTGVKGMRLWLEHEYHRVDAAVVWRTVTERLPELRSAIETELHR